MPPQDTSPQTPQPSAYPTTPNIVPGQPAPPPPPKKKRPVVLIAALVFFVIAFIGAIGYSTQIASERDDYKNNVDEKIAVAVEEAELELSKAKEAEFLEREKNPYRTYNGPAAYGEIKIEYPKTWSATVRETNKGKAPVDGYFHPGYVPGADSGTGFAVHLQVIEEPYDKVLGGYESDAKKGLVSISPYSAPKVPSVLGVRIDGQVARDHQGSTVLFPLRDKTISITTLSPQFIPDFNNIILDRLVFTP